MTHLVYPMNIRRTFDADAANQILNHPEVRPWVADMKEGPIDITGHAKSQTNILLLGDDNKGCQLFFKIMEGIYEVHTAILPEARGQWAKDFVEATRHYVFTRTDCAEVMTRVPEGHKAAEAIAKHVGMKKEFRREDGCMFHGKVHAVDVYSSRIQDWVPNAPFLEDRGVWLHEKMAKEAERLGIAQPPHGDDANHNRYVGAALEMVWGGQYQKAAAFYNRWAFTSRHATIKIVSIAPPTIRFDIGLLKFPNAHTVEIIPCAY